MTLKKLFVFVFLIFLALNIFSLPALSSNQTVTKTTNTDILITQSGGQTYYSTYVDHNNNTINIFTAHCDNSLVYLNNYSISNDQLSSSTIVNRTVSSLIGVNGYIQYDNYFISNNSRFLSIGSYFNETNTFTIHLLDTNKSISFSGYLSAYYLSLISRFPDSPDVYFSLYNQSMFFVVKYSFTTNNFSMIYHTNTSNLGISFPVTVFQQSNMIVASVNTPNKSSQFITLNETGLLFNKAFSFQISAFTPYNSSYLLYTNNGTLYSYSRSTDNLTIVGNTFNGLQFLKSFDNNTFMAVGLNFLDIYKINSTTTALNIYLEKSYSITYQYDWHLQDLFQAFNINNTSYYLYQNQYSYGYNNIIAINPYYIPPTNFNHPITTSSTYAYTTTNPNYTYASTSTQVLNSSSSGIAVILILVLLIGIGSVLIFKSKSRDDRYYPRRNDQYYPRRNSRSYNSQNHPYNTQSGSFIKKGSFCSSCGSPTLSDDVFCQNCGTRL